MWRSFEGCSDWGQMTYLGERLFWKGGGGGVGWIYGHCNLHLGSILLFTSFINFCWRFYWRLSWKQNHLRSHLIYKFQCSNCNITYYGETERHLKVRAGEHISTSPLTGKRVNNNKKSSVKDHCLLSGHACSFEDFTVLNYEPHKFKRLISESLSVTKDKPLMNKQVKSLKLELFWFKSTYAIFY